MINDGGLSALCVVMLKQIVIEQYFKRVIIEFQINDTRI